MMSSAPTVLVPLYIYPLTCTTWQPLYDAVSTYPRLRFLVIVNPNSGPGDTPLPGKDYIRELPKLNMHDNVSTVGYIRIDYCRKPFEKVRAEIDRYASWSEDQEHPSLGVEGILLDETPNHYSSERAEYLNAVRQYVRSAGGILGNRMVFHNPGTPPHPNLTNPVSEPGREGIITCEEPYEQYKSDEVQKRLAEYPIEPVRTGYMISAVPETEITSLVRELRNRGNYLFMTDLKDDFYESFGTTWKAFIAAMSVE